jgi:aminoglycoside phosphotransferase family enzyme/gluconate kinase
MFDITHNEPLKVSAMKNNERSLPGYISSLLQPDRYDHAVENIQLIETHISWVILTGHFAYKIKKTINLGFLDFSTLEKRHFYCKEELRLNAKLAPTIYLEVVPISRVSGNFSFSNSSEIIDYAIKMIQFPQKMQLDHMLAKGKLKTKHIDQLATMLAKFHQHTNIAHKNDIYGEPEQIYQPVKENFILLHQLLSDDNTIALLTVIERWSRYTFKLVRSTLTQRKQCGFVRECHGDLHLRNLVMINDHPVAFDCIEFSPELRWIDTINDVAFLMMDLHNRQHNNFAQRFLNTYLEKTGDYTAMPLLRFYLVYRAMVRAKVEALSASQMIMNSEEQYEANQACYNYLELANSYLLAKKSMLIITCGMSASGKSTLTHQLVEKLAAMRLRSDVERKRLFSVETEFNSSTKFNAGIYSSSASQHTYQHLAEMAKLLLNANCPVIIDAACLKFEQRDLFRQVAVELEKPFVILHFLAKPSTLRQRINSREKTVSDADLTILEHQLAASQALDENELSEVITVDTELAVDIDSLLNTIKVYFNQKKHFI